MAWRMVKQPNGTYARWSDIVDGFTHMNLSLNAAMEECRERLGRAEAEEKVQNADIDAQKDGRPGTGLQRWTECLTTMRALGKVAEAVEAEKADREHKTESED